MRTHTPHLLSIMTGALLSLVAWWTPAAFADTTITLVQPVHFTNAEGSDVVLDAGDYLVEADNAWLRVIPRHGQAVDAILLEAHQTKHEESLKEPLALSTQGEQADTHHLALLLPDGTWMESIGTYSGLRSRAGRASRVNSAKMRALAARQSSAGEKVVPEWSTLFFGGGGGIRNFNLDCGSNGIMTGTLGKWGSWLHELTVLCRTVNTSTGQLGNEISVGPTVGTAGGVVRPAVRCPENQVVAGIEAIRYGAFVHNITLICTPWSPQDRKAVGGRVNSLLGPVAQAIGTKRTHTYPCPPDKVGKAFRGRSGDFIDRIRFVCDQWNQ